MRSILHVSDVHFGPPHRPEVSDAVIDLVAERKPDLVIISGDLTQRAKRRQFRQARAWAERLSAPYLSVPGNHDVPMYRVWERVLAPYRAYSKHFSSDLEPVFEDEELFVIGVNTAFNWTIKGGRVTASRLEAVRELCRRAPEGAFKIVVAHHDLVPPPKFRPRGVARGARRAIETFKDCGVAMVLSGHWHQSYVARSESYYPAEGDERSVLLVHSGTSTSDRGRGPERGRNTCNWIEVDPTTLHIQRLGWRPQQKVFSEICRMAFPRQDAPANPAGEGLAAAGATPSDQVCSEP